VCWSERKPCLDWAELHGSIWRWEPRTFTGRALAYHALDREQDSDAALAGLIGEYSNHGAYQIAQVYAYRGQSQESFTWQERACEQRDSGLPEINSDLLFRNLHDHPRYAELLKNAPADIVQPSQLWPRRPLGDSFLLASEDIYRR
jgi:hypothetical protein